jgi:GntR family transcriptional regulator, rspAB operon transcriptional repressor
MSDFIHEPAPKARRQLRQRSASGLLKDQAYATLRELILNERFPPGSFLSERQLVAELGGMSKTPIRAALERLEANGLVLVSPQRGILVRELLDHEIIDIFDIRIALERFVVERLAGHINQGQRAALRQNLALAADCVQAGDQAGYAELDTSFHLLLAEFFDNREIVEVIHRNHDKLARVIMRVLRRDPARLMTSQTDHESIIEALLSGDGALAAERMRTHLEYGKNMLIS